MATKRMDIHFSPNARLDVGAFFDLVSNQITAATSPSVGDLQALVVVDGAADLGWKDSFAIPKEYVGSPVVAVRGILDGAPAAAAVLGFGFRKRAVADNEAADGTFDAEQLGSKTVGSNGDNYSDEDFFEILIPLTAGDYAIDDEVFFHCYLDVSVTTYAGNALITRVQFQFTDA